MVERNQYFDHHGNLIHGFPAKIFGFIVMVFGWGFALVFIATFVFR